MQDHKWNQNTGRRSCQPSPEAILSVNLILSFLPFASPTFCVATHESAKLANFGPKMTHSSMLGLVTSLKMMMTVVGALNFSVPQTTPPSRNFTIPRIFGCQDPVCRFDESLTSRECKVLRVVRHSED